MGIKEILQKIKEKKEAQMQRPRVPDYVEQARKPSANESELERYNEEERQKLIEKKVKAIRREKDKSAWININNSKPAKQGFAKRSESLMGVGDVRVKFQQPDNNPNMLAAPNIFAGGRSKPSKYTNVFMR